MTATEVTTGYFEHNGGTLYYETMGDGAPVVFVHGFTLDTRMWDDQWQPFADAGFKVIRYDVRGFGKSTDPDGPYSNHADLRALIEYLEEPKPHVVGLSMGGQIAMDYAIAYPDGLTSLVLIDSAMGGYSWTPAYRPSVLGLADIARRDGVPLAIEVWINNALFAPARENACAPRLVEIVQDYRGARWTTDDPIIALDPPAAGRLGEIKVPTLALVGEHDLPDFHTMATLVEKEAHNATKVIVPDAGHMANMEAPEAVNKLILDFLS